jgi:hypothetical protein
MTHTDLLAAVHRRLDEEPADWQARRELADLLEEAGDLAGAACQRWMAAARKHPCVSHELWWWPWYGSDCEEVHRLPLRVWAGLHSWGKIYATRCGAEDALAVALKLAGLIRGGA